MLLLPRILYTKIRSIHKHENNQFSKYGNGQEIQNEHVLFHEPDLCFLHAADLE